MDGVVRYLYTRTSLDQQAGSKTVYRVRRPTRLAVYGGLALAAVCITSGVLTFLGHAAALYVWIAGGVLISILIYAIANRVSRRASEYIELDAVGITSVSAAGFRTLPWAAIARLNVTRWGALEVSDSSRLMVVSISRHLESSVDLVRTLLEELDRAYAQRPSGARSRPSDFPTTFSSSVLPEALETVGSIASTVICAWLNPTAFVLGLIVLPVAMWRLSRTPYAITVGPVVRFSTLAWTRELPMECINTIVLTADARGRPSIVIDDSRGERVVVVISRLIERPLELYDRLRRLRDAREDVPVRGAMTSRIALVRGTAFLAGCVLIATLAAATPIFNGGLLRLAAARGDERMARTALALGSPVDSKGIERMTPLYLAARSGHLPVVKMLLARRANPSSQNRDTGFTPLHVAGEYGHVAIVRVLLDAGVQPNVRNYRQQTPLWQVSWQKRSTDVEVARILIDAGATIDAPDKDGWTPLHIAVRHGNLPILTHLASRGADLDRRINACCTPIMVAMANGRADSLRVLAEAGADLNAIDADGRTPLVDAVARGRQVIVEALLAAGARTDIPGPGGYDALAVAVVNGNQPLTELLLRHNVDPNAASDRVGSPLTLAVRKGHHEVVRTLLEAGARWDVPVGGYTALQRAAWQGDTNLVRVMLDKGVNPDAASPTHPPPIILAAERGHLGVVSLLADRGADINQQFQNWTALRAAEMRGHRPVIDYIRGHGGQR